MVIRYSIEELLAIGEMNLLRDCISRAQFERLRQQQLHLSSAISGSIIQANDVLQDYALFQQQLGQSNTDATSNQTDRSKKQELTNSVADFFRKAQQYFHPSASLDPAKVRRLSEVEGQLLPANTHRCLEHA